MEKPAYACLATRIPTGTAITPGLLARAEHAEEALAALGFSDFRVRLMDGAARVQVTVDQLPLALARREQIVSALKAENGAVLLDLEPRTPSR